MPADVPARKPSAECSKLHQVAGKNLYTRQPQRRNYLTRYPMEGVARVIKILLGFIAGVFYGVIYTVEVPDGLVAKAATILKMFISG